jgi:hypothetical protein
MPACGAPETGLLIRLQEKASFLTCGGCQIPTNFAYVFLSSMQYANGASLIRCTTKRPLRESLPSVPAVLVSLLYILRVAL